MGKKGKVGSFLTHFWGQNGSKGKVVIFGNGDVMVDPKLHFFGSKWGKTQSFEFGDWGRNESSHFC